MSDAATEAKEAPKSTIKTVTSGNFNEVFAEKLGLNKPEPVESVEVDPVAKVAEDAAKAEAEALAKKKEEVAEDTETGTDDDKKKKKQELNERFSKLTQDRKAAEQRAEAAERRAAELEAKLNPPKEVPDLEPELDQFKDITQYKEALKEWSADQAIKKRDAEESEKTQKEKAAQVVEDWNKRQVEFRQIADDYDNVIAMSDVKVGNEVRDAIIESDNGPALLYHLAQNPEIAEGMAKKSVRAALVELGRIEAKLAKEAVKEAVKAEIKEEQKADAKPAVAISKAPPPIKPLNGSGATVETQLASDGQYKGTYAQWKADRTAGKIR